MTGRDPAVDDAVTELAAAAWAMVVSQQAAPEGWSMSRLGYADTLREAVEPFLDRADGTGEVLGFRPDPLLPAEPPTGPVLRQYVAGEWVTIPRPWWPALIRAQLHRIHWRHAP